MSDLDDDDFKKSLERIMLARKAITDKHGSKRPTSDMAEIAMNMPLNVSEIHGYRDSDDCKAIAWDISHAIRALIAPKDEQETKP